MNYEYLSEDMALRDVNERKIVPAEFGCEDGAKSTPQFVEESEQRIAADFLTEGHAIVPVEDRSLLDTLRTNIVRVAAAHLGIEVPAGHDDFLNTVHERVEPESLNALRLHVINSINAMEWVRPAYFSLARRAIERIVGNELVMQRRLNLSVQMPGDESSLLPVHADVWDGDSPFEVVVWLPLVDCFLTKSMFFLPPEATERHVSAFHRFKGKSAEDLFNAVEPDLQWLEIAYGEVLIFSLTLLHGNRVNQEAQTRWSMNCRFKSLFSPFADKRLGEFFEPISIKPATRFGMNYKLPDGFRD